VGTNQEGTLKKSGLVVVVGTLAMAGGAFAAAKNSVSIQVGSKALVGDHVQIVFSGHDDAPKSGKGTLLSAVLEPPIGKGGGYCKSDLKATIKNHPRSITLLYQKHEDQTHTGSFKLKMHAPSVNATGKWRVCAWQFNDDGKSSFELPASHASARFVVSKG
jgi:hypothetical protein